MLNMHSGTARKPEPTSTLQQLVTFELFGEVFALPILDAREIIRLTAITPVPQAPAFVEGVINLRGQIIPIVDLRKRFGLENQPATEETRIIVVELASDRNPGMVIGLIVDAVHGVDHIPADSILPPPSLVAGAIGSDYIKGISNHDDKMIVHIDMRKVFNTTEMNALESA